LTTNCPPTSFVPSGKVSNSTLASTQTEIGGGVGLLGTNGVGVEAGVGEAFVGIIGVGTAGIDVGVPIGGIGDGLLGTNGVGVVAGVGRPLVGNIGVGTAGINVGVPMGGIGVGTVIGVGFRAGGPTKLGAGVSGL
jgi:hypothetical protein